MTTVVAIHSVGSMDQWLKGKDREKLFPTSAPVTASSSTLMGSVLQSSGKVWTLAK